MIAREQRDVRDAVVAQELHRVARRRARRVGDRDHAERLGVADDHGRVTVTVRGREPRVEGVGAQPALFEEPMAPEDETAAVYGSLGAASGQRLEVLDGGQRHAALARAGDDRRANRMLRAQLEGRGELQQPRRRELPTVALANVRAVERRDVHDVQLSGRQRAGLVERDAADLRQPLEPRAALDEHALARRRGQRRRPRPASMTSAHGHEITRSKAG